MEDSFRKPKHLIINALPHLSAILEKGLIKDLQENEDVCSVCQGTGLALTDSRYGLTNDPDKRQGVFPYTKQYLAGCANCYGGVIKRCKHCQTQIPRGHMNCTCEKAGMEVAGRRLAREREAFEKAIKLKPGDEKVAGFGMLYHERYPYNEGYFTSLDEFMEWWEDNHEAGEERPRYVWGTRCIQLHLDVDRILEDACDDLHEEALSRIEDKEELRAFLEQWCEKQTGTKTYIEDSRYVVEVPWEG